MASHPREPNPKERQALKDPTLKAPDSGTTQSACQARDEATTQTENTSRVGGVPGAVSEDELKAEVDRFLESLEAEKLPRAQRSRIRTIPREDLRPKPRAVLRATSNSELDAEVDRFLESLR